MFSDSNPWGYVPGEGAALLLLRPADTLSEATHHVVSVAVAEEPVGETDPGDSAFEALSRVIHEALHGLPVGCPLASLQSNWCNSRYCASELAYAMRRMPLSVLPAGMELEHLSLSLGDTGAAYLPVALALQATFPAMTVASSRSNQKRAAVIAI